jgi:hypothetical protein
VLLFGTTKKGGSGSNYNYKLKQLLKGFYPSTCALSLADNA